MEAKSYRAPSAPLAAAIAALLLTACSGTGNGGTGDPHAKPEANPYGDCSRLTDLQVGAPWFDPGNATSAGCKYPVERHVCVSGVTIVAIDNFDETGDGAVGNFYVQDTSLDPQPQSGVTVFDPSFS